MMTKLNNSLGLSHVKSSPGGIEIRTIGQPSAAQIKSGLSKTFRDLKMRENRQKFRKGLCEAPWKEMRCFPCYSIGEFAWGALSGIVCAMDKTIPQIVLPIGALIAVGKCYSLRSPLNRCYKAGKCVAATVLTIALVGIGFTVTYFPIKIYR
ncbi:MAG: hypothetical protein V4487_00210 [Chlamydiota bacterium]